MIVAVHVVDDFDEHDVVVGGGLVVVLVVLRLPPLAIADIVVLVFVVDAVVVAVGVNGVVIAVDSVIK